MRKKGGFWVCPRGCFSALGPPRCEHMKRLDRAVAELLKLVEQEPADPLEELLEIVEEI